MGCYGVGVEPDVRVRGYGDVAEDDVRLVMGAGSGFLSFGGAGGGGCCCVFIVVSEFGYYALLYMHFIVSADLLAVAVHGAGGCGCVRR